MTKQEKQRGPKLREMLHTEVGGLGLWGEERESREDRNDRTEREIKEKWRGIVGKHHGSFLCCQQKGPKYFCLFFLYFG